MTRYSPLRRLWERWVFIPTFVGDQLWVLVDWQEFIGWYLRRLVWSPSYLVNYLYNMGFKSVHMEPFPSDGHFPKEVIEAAHSDPVIRQMDLVREICSAGLSIRKRANIRIRMPLLSITVAGDKIDFLSSYGPIILDELNIKDLLVESNIQDYASQALEINFAKCGKRLRNKTKEIITLVKRDDWTKLSNGTVMVGSEILEPGEFSLKMKPRHDDENYEFLPSGIVIHLNTKITPSLEAESVARDMIRAIQILRKGSEFDISDRISVIYHTKSQATGQAIGQFRQFIMEQVLADLLISDSTEVEVGSYEHTSSVASGLESGAEIQFAISLHKN